MPTLTIHTSPVGSQLTSTIDTSADPPEPDDKNDFPIYITGDENFTLEQSDVSLTNGYSIQSFEGSGCSYKAVIRPPETAGVLTVSIAENAVPEGNDAVSQNIRVSTDFPDADAQDPTLLFSPLSTDTLRGLAITPTQILVNAQGEGVRKYTHAGTDTGESALAITLGNSRLDFINGDVLQGKFGSGFDSFSRYRLQDDFRVFRFGNANNFGQGGITHTRLGYADSQGSGSTAIRVLPYAYESENHFTEHDIGVRLESISHQGDMIYGSDGAGSIHYATISDNDTIQYSGVLNVSLVHNTVVDTACYQDTLYLAFNGADRGVYTLDIRPYRPLSKNTKTTIYPVFATNGDTIPLKQYIPDVHTVIWDTGFDLPDYLSINSNNEIVIANDAVTEATSVLVKVRGINYIDSIALSFYIIIEPATAPVWRDVEGLSMKANTTYNLHQIVDAEQITQQSGPTGSSTSNGIFTLGTTGGDATFRATKDGLTTDKTIAIELIQASTPDNFSDTFRYSVEIAGISIPAADLLKTAPIQVSKSSDNIELTKNRADSVSIALNNINDKYDPDATNNFWDANSLNPGGYQEEVKIYMENLISGTWESQLMFWGIIQGQAEAVSAVRVNLTAYDISAQLERLTISDFGDLVKWDMLRKLSDEATFEGPYVPEGSLLPIQPKTAEAYHDRTKLTRRSLQLPTHGPALENTMYVSSSDVRVSGGFFEEGLPVAKFKTYPRSQDIASLLRLLSVANTVYNTEIEVPAVTLEAPTVFNQGSVPFAVERTRTTLLPVDWVHDATNDRFLILLSNPERHIADLLVQWDIERKSYRTLHTFDKDVKAHRIERRNATNYYILTSGAITQDRSATTLPRTSDKTAYAYDSSAEGSIIRIHHYNATTNILTEFIPEDDDRPPQLGIHIHAGFENRIYIDEFEGVVPYDRGAFRWYDSNLYYRYATASEFGIARATASGTTSEIIDQTTLNYWNWLNFAFDIDTSNGDLFFVYAEGDADSSKLVIKKRTSGGTESTVLETEFDLEDLNDLDSTGGAFLGCHEALFHSDDLYIVCPIQRVDEDDSTNPSTYSRSREKSAGCVLYRCDVNAATPALTKIVSFDFIQRSAYGLVVYDSNVHYIENPIASTVFRSINPDL